jgi:hypothetical protein
VVKIQMGELKPWIKILLEKLTVAQLFNKFLALYGTGTSIAVTKRGSEFSFS